VLAILSKGDASRWLFCYSFATDFEVV